MKAKEGSVGDPEIAQLFGKLASGEFGVMLTIGTFTKQGRDFADGKANLRLIDGDELVRLILRYYDDIDVRYQSRIPLKRVWIPESAAGEAGG